MKKTLYYSLALLMLTTSCSEDFIKLVPVSQYSSDNFYKSEADINQAINGAYQILATNEQYGSNFESFMEIVSDNTFNDNTTQGSGEPAAFDNFVVLPGNSILNATWTSLYAGIQRCNVILNRIDNVSMSDELKATRKGEAKLIRALSYFNLVRIWGDVPLVTKEVNNSFEAFADTRTPAQTVYTQIIQDLKEASTSLTAYTYPNADKGRVTKGAALALLGKVYLTQKNYTECINTLQTIVGANAYSLLPSFRTVFDAANKNSAESIFEVQYLKNTASSGTGSTYDPTILTQSNNRPSQNAISFFGTDPRFALSVTYSPSGTTPSYAYSTKRFDTKAADGTFGHNVIVLRYADVLLMLAEAINEVGYNSQAFTYLNQVRTRAGLAAYTSTDLADQAAFRSAVERERRLELAFENQRWFDLLRTGKAVSVMNSATGSSAFKFVMKEYQTLFPIPQLQIDASAGKITQNQGY